MKTIVRAVSPRKVVDGWGNEMLLRRPKVEVGETYLVLVVGAGKETRFTILRKLLPQEILMADVAYSENTYLDQDHYEYCL